MVVIPRTPNAYTVGPFQTGTSENQKPSDFVSPEFLIKFTPLNSSLPNFFLSPEGVWFRGVPLY